MIEGVAANVDGGWNDLSNELYREYAYPFVDAEGQTHIVWLRVDNPTKVKIKRSAHGDSHRIVGKDADGIRPTSHYMPAGWLAIRWTGIDGTEAMSW